MRALDLITGTLDHCDRLWDAKATRSEQAVYRIARRAFVRSDYAAWFEHQFGHAILGDRDALAGLLLCFSLAVHSRFPYKRLVLPEGMAVILDRWVDPAPHHHPIFSKYVLSDEGARDYPNGDGRTPSDRLFTPPPLDCHFIGVYCPDGLSPFDISSVYIDIDRGPSTVLLIGPVAMIEAAEPWFKTAGAGQMINRPFGPDASLRLLYYSAR